MLREQTNHDGLPHDDVSAITNPTTGTMNEQSRTTAQVTLDNVSQALSHRRHVGAYYSSHRFMAMNLDRMSGALRQENGASECRAELDSHADTCGMNNTAYILEYT